MKRQFQVENQVSQLGSSIKLSHQFTIRSTPEFPFKHSVNFKLSRVLQTLHLQMKLWINLVVEVDVGNFPIEYNTLWVDPRLD